MYSLFNIALLHFFLLAMSYVITDHVRINIGFIIPNYYFVNILLTLWL